MRLLPLLAGLLLALTLVMVPAVAANTGYIGVNQNLVYKFDVTTYQTTSTITTGANALDMVLTSNADRLYILGPTKIQAYSLSTGQQVGSVNIAPGSVYRGTLKLSPDGSELYAVIDRYVYTVDTDTFQLVSNVSISNTYNGAGYADLDANGYFLFIPIGSDLVAYNAMSGTVTNTFTMPAPVVSAFYDNSNDYNVYLASWTGNKVFVAHGIIGTVTGTINLAGNISDVRLTPDRSTLIVADASNQQLVFIDADNYTAQTTLSLGAGPYRITPNQDNNKEFVSCPGDSLIKVVDPQAKSVVSTITVGHAVWSVAVPKYSSEGTQYYAPHPVKYHLTSFIRDQSNITANVTDEAGNLVASGTTGTDGCVVFQLYSDRWYTVTFQDGSTWEGYPADSQYDIFYLSFSLGTFLNPGSNAPVGHEDQLKEITASYDDTIDPGTGEGTLTCLYNDTSGGTTSVNFSLYYRNTSTAQYDLIESQVVNTNNATAIFTITNASGNGYRVVITAQNSYYGEVQRQGDVTFDGGYSFDMGWPSYMYVAFCFVMSMIIGFNTSRDFYITLGGGALFIGFNWCFYLIGWTSGMGLIIPISLSVCTIILALFAVAEWRQTTGV